MFPSFSIEVKWLKLILTCSVDSVNSKKQAGNQNLSFIFLKNQKNNAGLGRSVCRQDGHIFKRQTLPVSYHTSG
ncbi:hypothetical protein AYX07_02010 [Thermoactinomyces sp. AS95]|nr:hypothetical protein AYX07_02010 [Thermoactinomyces sp. AS95]